MRFPLLRCHAAALAAAGALAVGCGEQEPPVRPAAATPAADHAGEVARNPYAVTCGDLADQPRSPEAQKLVIRAEFALAREPVLRTRVKEMTLNRAGRSVYWALTELCKGRERSFRPARQAVEAVRRGEYLVQPRPESWSRPERWWKDGEGG